MNEVKKHERKIRELWEKEKIFEARDFDKKSKFYCLDMFPYPSGEGLHIGHIEGYTASDIFSRFKIMQGYNVLHPMGWDAFGLPAENYAIKTKTHPRDSINKNVANFKRQLDAMGFGYDWSREINTTDPEYYRWTQWIFLKLFERGLAYEADVPVNWCTKDKVVLADEEVVNGHCERDGAPVVKKNLKQWMLKITAYADSLLKDLDDLDWPEKIKEMQRNWIGRSEGTEIKFKIQNAKVKSISKKSKVDEIKVFTTRADTLFGVTYLVVAPEHSIISNLKSKIENFKVVEEYIKKSKGKSDLERTGLAKEKTGVELKGIKAINPANREEVPVWVADYVLGSYGTGAVMAVPGHDNRDYQFAKKYGLPIKDVIRSKDDIIAISQKSKIKSQNHNLKFKSLKNSAFEEDGILINSGQFTSLGSAEARIKIIKWLEKNRFGSKKIQYKLRDWVFSRQRFWGEPMPLVFCEHCKKEAEISNLKYQISKLRKFNQGELLNQGWIVVEEKDLPVELPKVKSYSPTGKLESPLADIKSWVNVRCPRCGRPAKRETNTMPQWAGSSWYFLAFALGTKNLKLKTKKYFYEKDFKDLLKYWLPVNLYIGGAEHAVLHLLYARFWTKFLFDIGVCPVSEPFKKLVNQGIILSSDGRKMSKSLGNVVNPEAVIEEYNADTLRLYEMFMGPLEDSKLWSTKGILGVKRFLDRICIVINNIKNQKSKIKMKNQISKSINITIEKVTKDIEALKFNTAISTLMIFFNGENGKPDWRDRIEKTSWVDWDAMEKFLMLLSPFAPFAAEYLWLRIGNKKSIFNADWPKAKATVREKRATIIIQINGKLRDTFETESESKEEIKKQAMSREKVRRFLSGKKPQKIIYIPRRLVNFVV